jgi:hypothetical protein
VLSQLASGTKFDDLAGEIAQLQARLQPSLVALSLPSSAPGAPRTSAPDTALRLRDDLAVAFVPAGSTRERLNGATIIAHDAASGLAVVRVATPMPAPPAVPWTPRQPVRSRYLAASDVSSAGVSLRPVFMGSFDPIDSPFWSEPVWAVPERADLAPGSFLFTSSAELAGLVISHGRGLKIVPGGMVVAEAERLLATQPGPRGAIGVEVQNLTPALAAATGAQSGVIVTWVDAGGAARKLLMAGDVIEAVDGQALAMRQQWDVRVARLSASEKLSLRVRRGGEVRDVALVANSLAPRPASQSLGLSLRARTGAGSEVVRIDEGAAADRAGLTVGDVITLIADVRAPTPAQVLRSYNALREGQRVVVAITRGETHFVTVFER